MSLRKLLLLAGAGLAVVAVSVIGWLSRSQAQPPRADATPEAWKDCKYQNAASCTRCHVQPTANDLRAPGKKSALDVALLTEYSIWKTHDKHAQAYAVLEGVRGKSIGKLLGQDVLKPETGCLNCHAMGNLATQADQGGLDLKDGVSCGGCHGPSSKWYNDHSQVAWREKTPEEKYKLGMRDLRDPVARAEVCMSCHVGAVKEGKVVTHAMMAAGHPPLPPIEVATFSRNEPQHWRDARDLPYLKENLTDKKILAAYGFRDADDVKFQRTRMAVIGAVVALRDTVQLARDRVPGDKDTDLTIWPELANKSIDGGARERWPEVAMAHSDCFACHHDLKYPGFRQQRGFGYHLPGREPVRVTPGRPIVRIWPVALQEPSLAAVGQKEQIDKLETSLKALVKASNTRPFGKPAEIGAAAGEVSAWTRGAIDALAKAKWDSAAVLRLMHNLCAIGALGKEDGKHTPYLPDQESARQIVSLLAVAFEDWTAAGGKADGVKPLLDELATMVDLQPYFNRPERLKVTFGIVARGQNAEGLKAFEEYLRDPSSDKQVEASASTRGPLGAFLADVRGVRNDDFNAGLVKESEKLQKLSDAEQVKLLKTIADFEPRKFLAVLQEVGKKLPPSGR